MLDKIMEMVGGQAINAITEKAGISTDQAKQMLPFAQESLQEGLMSQVTGGNLDSVLGMFKSFTGGGLASNGLFGSLKAMFMKKVMTNMGLPESVAGLAAGAGMTSIIGGLTDQIKGAGDTDDIDASSLMSVLGGGEGMLGNVAGMLGGLAGNNSSVGDGGMMDNLKDAAKDKLGDIAGGFFSK